MPNHYQRDASHFSIAHNPWCILSPVRSIRDKMKTSHMHSRRLGSREHEYLAQHSVHARIEFATLNTPKDFQRAHLSRKTKCTLDDHGKKS